MIREIKQYLKENLLLFDGAMGTYYAKTAVIGARQCELANLSDRKRILEIHREYLEAGCKAIKTNTFLANPRSLSCGMEQAKRVISEGWQIAQEAAETKEAFVFADIGPIPQDDEEDLFETYREIVDCFLQLGAKHFLFETFSAPVCLPRLFQYLKIACPSAFLIASFSVLPGGCTQQGLFGTQLYQKFSALPETDAVGFNCVCGPYHLRRFIRQLPEIEKPLIVMPNAGYPSVVDNRTVFAENAAYFAGEMREIVDAGARIIGGCCGTTPALLRAVKEWIEGYKASAESSAAPDAAARCPRPRIRNRLAEKLAQGKRVVAVELDPPLDCDGDFFMSAARKLKELGVDAITIADCPVSRARADSSLLACKLRRELDVDPIPHLTCRDRNINATKALLLGLSMEGVNNILTVTGDPILAADREEVKGVYNFNSPPAGGIYPVFERGASQQSLPNLWGAECERGEFSGTACPCAQKG